MNDDRARILKQGGGDGNGGGDIAMEEDGIRDGQSDTREDEGEDDDASLADGDELGNGDDNAGDGWKRR